MTSGKGSFIVQAIVCLGVVIWQLYDIFVAGVVPSLTMGLFDAVVLIGGTVGFIGAIYALRKATAKA